MPVCLCACGHSAQPLGKGVVHGSACAFPRVVMYIGNEASEHLRFGLKYPEVRDWGFLILNRKPSREPYKRTEICLPAEVTPRSWACSMFTSSAKARSILT